jgi:glucan phosphoethanolaminetransferase (alkaline phosphatase superfamily)
MIQRVQSIYLFLASIAIYALFLFPFVNTLNGINSRIIKVTGVYEELNGQVVQTEPFLLLTIATAILGLIPLVLIFLYKNRKRQATFIYILVVILLGYSFWIAQTVKSFANTTLEISNYNIGAGLSSVAVLFLILAAKGVMRDEKLVKSADRLR